MTSRLILEVCIIIKVIRIDAVSRVIGMAIELVICIIRLQKLFFLSSILVWFIPDLNLPKSSTVSWRILSKQVC